MEKRKLLNYLETVINLEKTKLTYQKVIEDMNFKTSMLGIPRKFAEPSAPQKPTYEKADTKDHKNIFDGTKSGATGILMGVAGIVLALLLALVIGPWLSDFAYGKNILITIAILILILALVILIIFLIIFGIVGCFSIVIGFIKDVYSNIKESERVSTNNRDALERVAKTNDKKLREYNEQYARYKKDYSEYLNKVKADKKRVTVEKYQIAAINWEKSFVEAALKKINGTLEKYYSLDILRPKYRNLPYTAQIYDYLYNGLCDNLEGTHNAYYILEEELRMQRLTDKMDEIIVHLERIEANQSKLYTVVSSVNQTTLKISDGVSRFAHSYAIQSDLLIKENKRLTSTLKNNQQQLNAKVDEATRNWQICMKNEHDNSELGLYLSKQNQKDLDYIASYVQYKDNRIGATRV